MTRSASLASKFLVSIGSVRGSDHLRLGRNNQDAAASHTSADVLVAVVADGCSAGPSSEVGARFAASWLSSWVPRSWRSDVPARVWIDDVTRRLVGDLWPIARALSPEDEDVPSAVHEFLLFSFLVVVVDRARTVVFGAGDGVFAIDGAAVVLDPGPENAPAYLSYALLDRSLPPPRDDACVGAAVKIHRELDTRDVRSVLLATDGALDLLESSGAEETLRDGTTRGVLAQFTDARYAKNPSLVQKRLNVLGDAPKKLRDDTTIALISRRETA
jgi:serine/threonine protein phosphatase PrpC